MLHSASEACTRLAPNANALNLRKTGEFSKFCEKPLTAKQLHSAKEQIKGQLAIAEENNLGLMLMMGRSVLDFGRVPALEEIFDKIQGVTPLQLQSIASEAFDEKKLSYLIMEPK